MIKIWVGPAPSGSDEIGEPGLLLAFTLNLTTLLDYAAEIIVRGARDLVGLLLTRFKDKISAIVDMFRYDYYSLSRKKIEVPFAWLTTGAILLIIAILFAPADLDYSHVSPGQISFFVTLSTSIALGAGRLPSSDIGLSRSTGGVTTP